MTIINSILQRVRTELNSTVERKVYKFAKIHPINIVENFIPSFDIETGFYYGQHINDECRITIHYDPHEECKWADDEYV